MSSLRLLDSRKPVYFGTPFQRSHSGLEEWIVHGRRIMRGTIIQKQHILQDIHNITRIGNLRRSFCDWKRLQRIRQISREHCILRAFRNWRMAYLLKRFSVLNSIIDNTRPLVRHRFQQWRDKSMWLKAIQFYNINTIRNIFLIWKQYLNDILLQRMKSTFGHWCKMASFSKKLRAIVSILFINIF